jgi:hypothetical protein
LDKRVSEINAAGLTIVNEEDKQYLANIAKMEGGTYKVKIDDVTTKELSQLNQEEFDKLIDEQKNAPKDMEDIARSQMKLSEVMLSDVAAIRAKFVGGVVSAGPVLQGKEDLRSGITNVTGEFSKMGDTASVRKPVEAGLSDIKKLIDDLKEGDNYTEDVAKYLENSGKLLGKIEEDFKKSLEETGEKISKGFEVGSNEQKLTDMLRGKIGETEASQQAAGNQTVSSFLEGRQNQMREVEAASSASAGSQRTQIELVGGIKMDITFNGDTAGFTPVMKEQLAKELTNKFNSMDYKQFMTNITTKQDPTKGPVAGPLKL